MADVVAYLAEQLEHASKQLVWQSAFVKSAGLAGLYESVGGVRGVAFHGFGLTSRRDGIHVEAYCDRGATTTQDVRSSVALLFGIPSRSVDVLPCEAIVPQIGVGHGGAHHRLWAQGGVGTIGGFAGDVRSDLLLAVSNNHVFADCNRGKKNDDLVDARGNVFGGLHRFSPLLRQPKINDLDAAVGWTFSDIERRGPARPISGTRKPEINLAVHKWGTTTGHTRGRIVGVAATAVLAYPGLGNVNFRGCLRIEGNNGPFSLPGDSGSLVLDSSNAVVGLVFAGSSDGAYTFANPASTLTNRMSIWF